jgi:hypothetical protein
MVLGAVELNDFGSDLHDDPLAEGPICWVLGPFTPGQKRG